MKQEEEEEGGGVSPLCKGEVDGPDQATLKPITHGS